MVISCMKGIEQGLGDHRHAAPDRRIGLPTPLKTASVAAQAIGGVPLDDEQVDNIRYLRRRRHCRHEARECHDYRRATAAFTPGMKPDNGGPGGDPYAQAVRKAEQTLTAKIRNALSYIPNVTVTSTVTLDHEKGSRSVEIKNDPKPVPVRTSENSRTSNRDSASSGGAPGIQAQGGGANQPASLGTNGGKGSNETSEETKNETGQRRLPDEHREGDLRPDSEIWPRSPSAFRRATTRRFGRSATRPRRAKKPRSPTRRPSTRSARRSRKDVRTHVANLLPTAPEVKDPDVAGDRHDLPGHQGRRDPGPGGDAAGLDVAGAELADGGDGRPGAFQPGHVAIDASQRSGPVPVGARPRSRCA